MDEKDACEDGGEGGEGPQVQDGADQGYAAQLPVVAEIGQVLTWAGTVCTDQYSTGTLYRYMYT